MRVDAVMIARYRSIGDLNLRPHALMVLVGPNNAGKSNVVDAIDFVAESYRYGLELAVARKGGFENVAHRKQRRTKSPMSFTVAASINMSDMRPWTYARRPASVPESSVFRGCARVFYRGKQPADPG